MDAEPTAGTVTGVAARPHRRFAALLADAGQDVPLDEACLLIAADVGSGDVAQASLTTLDDLAAGVAAADLDALRRHLFDHEGFRGDRTTYYDARNSLLPEVLGRRLGIPITLAVVAIEVGRRCGVDLVGVGMPGHFLVRPADDEARFLDVFDGGSELDRAGCRAVFERVNPGLAWDDRYLRPVDSRAILARILANLANAYRRSGDRRSLCAVLELRAHLPGSTERERRELAVLLGASGRFGDGAEALEALGGARDVEAAMRLRARMN